MKHGTRVAAVMTATALMMTAAVSGLTLVESLTQETTMAADTTIVPSPPVADLAAADVLYSASGIPELPSLAGVSDATDSSTAAAAQPTTDTAQPVAQPAARPATQVRESDDHPSGNHQQQDD